MPHALPAVRTAAEGLGGGAPHCSPHTLRLYYSVALLCACGNYTPLHKGFFRPRDVWGLLLAPPS